MRILIDKFNPIKDGITNDAKVIQEAINYVSENGGGTLVITAGNYSLGTIVLQSNVTLYLEKGAFLKMSPNLEDYITINSLDTTIKKPTYEDCSYDGKPEKYFIYAKDKENISIMGEGIIDGNEEIFYGNITKWHIEGAFYPRIPLICIENTKEIKLEGITVHNSAFWTVHLVGSKDIEIKNIKIKNNLRMTNSDGIDPDHCQNVLIENCIIEAADDCIVLKNTKAFKEYGATSNIIVRNCILKSTSAAIKFGSESVSDFSNVSFENIKILSSNRGISLQLRDEGNISDVHFKNIAIETRLFSPKYWWGKAEAIAITAVKRDRESLVGQIQNISFDNIEIDSENGIFIYGTNYNIKNIMLNNVRQVIKRKTKWPLDNHDIRPYYGEGIFQDDLSAAYVFNASDITFANFSTKFEELEEVKKVYYNLKATKNIKII